MPEQDPLGGLMYETSLLKVSQGAAGTTTLVTPGATQKVYVTGAYLTLDAAGTLKFTESAGDLTGTFNLGGAAAPPLVLGGGSNHPVLWTSTVGEALQLTSGTGKAQGYLTYYVA